MTTVLIVVVLPQVLGTGDFLELDSLRRELSSLVLILRPGELVNVFTVCVSCVW